MCVFLCVSRFSHPSLVTAQALSTAPQTVTMVVIELKTATTTATPTLTLFADNLCSDVVYTGAPSTNKYVALSNSRP